MIIYNPQILDIELTPVIGFDTEFNDLDTKHAKLICFSITNSNNITYVCDLRNYTKQELVAFFNDVANLQTVICHNSKAEIGVVYSNIGVLLRNCWCTMLASQVIDNGYGFQVSKDAVIAEGYTLPPDYTTGKLYYSLNMVGGIKYITSPHSLLGCLKRYLNITDTDKEHKKLMQRSFIDFNFKQDLTQEQLDYAAADTKHLIPLHLAEQKHIQERNLQNIINLENKLTPILIKMEFKGCKIDIQLHKQNINKWATELNNITKELDLIVVGLEEVYPGIKKFNFNRDKTIINQMDLFGLPKEILLGEEAFNYSSTKQLTQLFEATQQPLPINEDKVSFGEESLVFYITNNPQSIFVEFLNLLLKYREFEKLLGTYSEKVLDNLDGEYIRTSYSQCWTDTGRLSSSEIKEGRGLNLANIPKNPDIRKIFVPDEGFVFIDSDMTGQELVIAADFAKEPVLLKAFQEGFDHHSFLASISYSLIFGQQVEIKNANEIINVGGKEYNVKKLRDDHKACLFSKIYLGGPKRIQAILNAYLVNHVPPDERFNRCKQISNALDKTLKTLITFLKGKVDTTKQCGYTLANKLGRRRYFDRPAEVFGDAANVSIQGTGADAMKIAMINLDKFFETKAKELGVPQEEFGWLTLSIYDQVLCNLNTRYIAYKEEVAKIMGEALTYFLTTLQGSSDLNVRNYWGK
jgi:DNA polymerase I-like protein with 3'-5' exonuclease and polymerase domains